MCLPKEAYVIALVTKMPWCSDFPEAEPKVKDAKTLKENRPCLFISWLTLVFYHGASLPNTVSKENSHHHFRIGWSFLPDEVISAFPALSGVVAAQEGEPQPYCCLRVDEAWAKETLKTPWRRTSDFPHSQLFTLTKTTTTVFFTAHQFSSILQMLSSGYSTIKCDLLPRVEQDFTG